MTARNRAAAIDMRDRPDPVNAELLGKTPLSQYRQQLESEYQYFYHEHRHGAKSLPTISPESLDWRLRERMKTVSVALVLCLNLGVDPPDIIKPEPCARLEAWFDPVTNKPVPTTLVPQPPQQPFAIPTANTAPVPDGQPAPNSTSPNPAQKALEIIANNLQTQYELWQPRSRYKHLLDPTAEDLKKLLSALRRHAREDRVLMHYNGHGVPRPTKNGEIWVFNKSFTQYIPVSVWDIQGWVGRPAMFVWDCSHAGCIVDSFQKFALQRDQQALAAQAQQQRSPSQEELVQQLSKPGMRYMDCIHLAACRNGQVLPMVPEVPADMFTSCLTTPIEMALRWYVIQNRLLPHVNMEILPHLPGKLNDRRTPLGELNWIFTSITDTIAWNTLPRSVFKLLFRQDLMVAALFRNFLLADRIMRSFNCTPVSVPVLPSNLHLNPLWDAWDLAVDMCLVQLHSLINPSPEPVLYRSSTFFAEQLTAFELWLDRAAPHRRRRKLGYTSPNSVNIPTAMTVSLENMSPPQLPIVLQVLLSQQHRLRALILLSQFLDLGQSAVHQALSVGIFPYVLKLLQSHAQELRLVLVFIWARILAVDSGCRVDLCKDGGYMYFVNVLKDQGGAQRGPLMKSSLKPLSRSQSALNQQQPPPPAATTSDLSNVSELKAMSAFILSAFCHQFRQGKNLCRRAGLVSLGPPSVAETPLSSSGTRKSRQSSQQSQNSQHRPGFILSHYFQDEDPLLRQWAVICWGEIMGTGDPENLSTSQHSQNTNNNSNPSLEKLTPPEQEEPLPPVIDLMECEDRMVDDAVKLLKDSVAEVRAAALYALGLWINIPEKLLVVDRTDRRIKLEQQVGLAMMSRTADASTLVRTELVVSLSKLVSIYQNAFVEYALEYLHEEKMKLLNQQNSATVGAGGGKDMSLADRFYRSSIYNHSFYSCVWKVLLNLCMDPVSEVAQLARNTVDFINLKMMTREWDRVKQYIPPRAMKLRAAQLQQDRQTGLRRTGSFSSSLRSMFGTVTSATDEQQLNSNNLATPVSPSTSHSRRQSQISNQQSLGGSSVTLPTFPLISNYFEWSLAFFTEPRLRPNDDDLPGGLSFMERDWRRRRNEFLIRKARPALVSNPDRDASQIGFQRRFDQELCTLDIQADLTRTLAFHPFDDTLVLADDKNRIQVWRWGSPSSSFVTTSYGSQSAQGQRCLVNRFRNGNLPGSHITSIKWINPQDIALLVTASDEGIVRIYRDYDDPDQTSLVSAWRSVPELLPDETGSGLVMEWVQSKGILLVGGDSKMIRCWDVDREVVSVEMQTGSTSCLTSLAWDKMDGNISVGGFGDGSIRVFDSRLPAKESVVATWKEHQQWVTGVHQQHGSRRYLLSVSTQGDVRSWDIRRPDGSLSNFLADNSGHVSASALHDYAPIMAIGSDLQFIKVFDVNTLQPLAMMRYHDGFLGNRIAPVTCLAFHPILPLLASGGSDQLVSLYDS